MAIIGNIPYFQTNPCVESFLKAPWPKHCKTYCHESQLRSIGKFSGQAASLLPPASLKWLRWQHLSTGTTLSLTVYYIECFPVPTVRKCPFLLLCHHRGVTNFVLQLAILCRHVWTFFFQIKFKLAAVWILACPLLRLYLSFHCVCIAHKKDGTK